MTALRITATTSNQLNAEFSLGWELEKKKRYTGPNAGELDGRKGIARRLRQRVPNRDGGPTENGTQR